MSKKPKNQELSNKDLVEQHSVVDGNKVVTTTTTTEVVPTTTIVERSYAGTVNGNKVPVLTADEIVQKFDYKNYREHRGSGLLIFGVILAVIFALVFVFRFLGYFFPNGDDASVLGKIYSNNIVNSIIGFFNTVDKTLFGSFEQNQIGSNPLLNGVYFNSMMLAGSIFLVIVLVLLEVLIVGLIHLCLRASEKSKAKSRAQKAKNEYLRDVEQNQVKDEYTISKSGEIIPILNEEELADEFSWKHYTNTRHIATGVVVGILSVLALFILIVKFGWMFTTEVDGVYKTYNSVYDFFFTNDYMKVWIVPIMQGLDKLNVCVDFIFGSNFGQQALLENVMNSQPLTSYMVVEMLFLFFILFNGILLIAAVMRGVSWLLRKPNAERRAIQAEHRYLKDVEEAGLNTTITKVDYEKVQNTTVQEELISQPQADIYSICKLDNQKNRLSDSYDELFRQTNVNEAVSEKVEPLAEQVQETVIYPSEVVTEADVNSIGLFETPLPLVQQEAQDEKLVNELVASEVKKTNSFSYPSENPEIYTIANFSPLHEQSILDRQNLDGIITIDEDMIAKVTFFDEKTDVYDENIPITLQLFETPVHQLVSEDVTTREDDWFLLEGRSVHQLDKDIPYELLTKEDIVENNITDVVEKTTEQTDYQDIYLKLNAVNPFVLTPVDALDFPQDDYVNITEEPQTESVVEDNSFVQDELGEEQTDEILEDYTPEVRERPIVHDVDLNNVERDIFLTPDDYEENKFNELIFDERYKEFEKELQNRQHTQEPLENVVPLEEVYPLVEDDEVLSQKLPSEEENYYNQSEVLDTSSTFSDHEEEIVPLEEVEQLDTLEELSDDIILSSEASNLVNDEIVEEPTQEESAAEVSEELAPLEEVEQLSEDVLSNEENNNLLAQAEEIEEEVEALGEPVIIEQRAIEEPLYVEEQLSFDPYINDELENNELNTQVSEDSEVTPENFETVELEEVEALDEDNNNIISQEPIDEEVEEMMDEVILESRPRYEPIIEEGELEDRYPNDEVEDNQLVSQPLLEEDIEQKQITTSTGVKTNVKHVGPLNFNPNLQKRPNVAPINPIKVVQPVAEEPIQEETQAEEEDKPNNVTLLHKIDERSKPKDIKPIKFKKVRFDLKRFKVKTYDGDLTPEEAFIMGVTKVNPVVNPTFQNQKEIPEWKRKRMEEERKDFRKKGYVKDAKVVSTLEHHANKKQQTKFDKTPSDFDNLREYNKARKAFYDNLKNATVEEETNEVEPEVKVIKPINVVKVEKQEEKVEQKQETEAEKIKFVKPITPKFNPANKPNKPTKPIKLVDPFQKKDN